MSLPTYNNINGAKSDMKRVSEIRVGLRRIPDALDVQSTYEWKHQGHHRVLWDPDNQNDTNVGNMLAPDEEDARDGIQDDLIPVVEIAPEIEADVSTPLLDDMQGSEVAARVHLTGIEALAWYVPFHQERFQWGCYLSVTGIFAIADALLHLKLKASRRIQLAVHALLRHEITHFAVEYMAAQWELSVGAPCYLRARNDLRDSELGYIKADEKVANAYMLRGFRYPSNLTRCAGALEALRQYTTLMPPGYSHGYHFVEKDRFQALLGDIAQDYTLSFPQQAFTRSSIGLDLLSNYPDRRYFDTRVVPIFLVSDTKLEVLSSLVLRFIANVGRIDELKAFRMSLSGMSSEVQRAWERTKNKLSQSTSFRGLNFKPWGDGADTFSVRVTASVRAHLRLNRSESTWIAYEIGQHKDVGHG